MQKGKASEVMKVCTACRIHNSTATRL